MTVKELIEILSGLPDDVEIFIEKEAWSNYGDGYEVCDRTELLSLDKYRINHGLIVKDKKNEPQYIARITETDFIDHGEIKIIEPVCKSIIISAI